MIDSFSFKKMAAHIIKRERGAHDRQLVHPVREWMFGLAIVSMGVVVGGGVSFYMYEATRHIEVAAETIPTVPYRTEVVTAANTKYEKRRAAYDALIGRNPASVHKESEQTTSQSTTTASTTDTTPSATLATTTPIDIISTEPVIAQ